MLARDVLITAIAIRSGLGTAFFLSLLALPRLRPKAHPSRGDALRIGGSALSGVVPGMSFLMAALAVGDFGIVTTLPSTSPILILPMVWFVTRSALGIAAWGGAALPVLGTGLITLSA